MPKAELPLETYAAVAADMIGVASPAECHAIAERHGIAAAAWDAAAATWAERLAGRNGAVLGKKLRELLKEHLERRCAGVPPIDLDGYVSINAAVHAGVAAEDAFAAAGVDVARFTLASYAWMDRFESDPRLDVYFRLRVQQALAARTKRSARTPFTTYRAGNLVRARRCSRCGALKATKPLTAYVYCDFCATLFDYDVSVALDDPTALDADMVDRELQTVSVGPLREALAANDRAAYAEIIAWRSDVSTEVCPASYSPRIKDPEYRRAFVHELVVPWTVVTQFDPAFRAAAAKTDAARRRVVREPTLAKVLTALEASRVAWRIESDLLERAGIFAKHPDGYDATMFLFVNASTFARPWLAVLERPDQDRLLEAIGVKSEYVPAPVVTFVKCGCGHCGRALEVPAGAKRMVCDACGFVLEVGTHRFACSGCGAMSSVPAGALEAVCAYCSVRWTL